MGKYIQMGWVNRKDGMGKQKKMGWVNIFR